MARRVSKKAVIRQYVERERPAAVGQGEAAAMRAELRQALGSQARISDEYLMGVLDELQVPVARELRGVPPELYATLHYNSLESAESTVRQLDARYRRALEAGEQQTVSDCRDAALFIRRRAELIAGNRRVAPVKRAEKEEIARWFAIWLQTPEMFFDWLELRKNTAEFRELVEIRRRLAEDAK